MAGPRKYLANKLSRLRRLGELLVEENYISEEQLASALEMQKITGGLLGEILISHHFATEWEIAKCLVSQLQIPFLQLSRYDISASVAGLLPHAFLHQHRLVPIDLFGRSLLLATAGNITDEMIEEIELTTHYEVMLYIALSSDIQSTLQSRFPLERVTNELTQRFDQLFPGEEPPGEEPSPAEGALPGEPGAAGLEDEWRPS